MSDPKPAAYARRSYVYRVLEEAGASFIELAGAAVAARFPGDAEDEAARAREMGLADITPLPRGGFKGRGAIDWLRRQGIAVGDDNNRAYPVEGGALALRLADSEAVILGDLAAANDTCGQLDIEWSMETADGGYPVPRRSTNFWFLVTGRQAPAMFAKICGVDLRSHKFANHDIAQTSVARTNVVIVRDDQGELPLFHVLGDGASAEYMWGCLLDAMEEFGGGPVGYLALNLNNQT